MENRKKMQNQKLSYFMQKAGVQVWREIVNNSVF